MLYKIKKLILYFNNDMEKLNEIIIYIEILKLKALEIENI